MGQIITTNGKVCLVDDEDMALVSQHRWIARRCAQREENYYAVSAISGKTVYMHRLLLAAPRDLQVDHKNRNGLDNRRENIRLCTRAQNNVNRAPRIGLTGYIGVVLTRHGKYSARLSPRRKVVCLGTYATAEEAALARDKAAVKFYGEFAVLNFPDEEEVA